jgi:hypothetical protein
MFIYANPDSIFYLIAKNNRILHCILYLNLRSVINLRKTSSREKSNLVLRNTMKNVYSFGRIIRFLKILCFVKWKTQNIIRPLPRRSIIVKKVV